MGLFYASKLKEALNNFESLCEMKDKREQWFDNVSINEIIKTKRSVSQAQQKCMDEICVLLSVCRKKKSVLKYKLDERDEKLQKLPKIKALLSRIEKKVESME